MNIALLIDCENAEPASIHGILSELAEKGSISIRRAYGNWKNQASWEQKLHPFAILPVQQFAYTKGKNAVDMCMAIDAMELHYTEKVDAFALVSSDFDFTPLALKLLAKDKKVFGFGKSTAPEPFKKACTEFIETDSFQEPTPDNPEPQQRVKKSKLQLKGDTELMNALRGAVDAMKDEDGWSPLQKIGTYITNTASLSCKNYGYAKWGEVIRATEYFEMELREKNHTFFRRSR